MSTNTKKKTKRPAETLFPLPKNRKRTPTDAETLLHALCIAIRDHKSHAVLRGLIAHLPRIMNRANPYNATEQKNFELSERVGQLEAVLRKIIPRLKRQTAKDKAVAEVLSHDTSHVTPAVAQADAQSDAGERSVQQMKDAGHDR
jgi:hypothetical protein